MAADQLNKRSKANNVIRHTSWVLQKAKKKKISHYDLNTRLSISLEWDEVKEHVVSKKEQVGIARRELSPFLPIVPHCQNVLGDIFAVPSELFELDNLTDLLSYEVWQTHLSIEEREFLNQFLPEGVEPHKIVNELFAGNNFCFGNSFSKWGASICSGDCHPDAILRQEQCNKANKIAYYSELHKYHTKMIGTLQLWKERWASCVNPENDFMQKILRSRKDFLKCGSSHENSIQCGPEEDLEGTSESYSWDADDNSCSSDSPDLTSTDVVTKIRASGLDVSNKCDDSSDKRKFVTKPRKGDKLHRLNIESSDGAKYMSYIKVSKEQHQRVKNSMKNSNASIQPRSLNHVLGNLGSFCVQPYKVFEEEERQKLHEHWLNLAKKDLPAGLENWKTWRSANWQLTKSLGKEMEDKWKSNEQSLSNLYSQEQDKENEESPILIVNDTCNATSDSGLMNETKDNNEQNADPVFQPEEELITVNHETPLQVEHTDDSSQDSAQNDHLSQIAIHNGSQNFSPMALNASNDVLTESDAFTSSLGEYTENINHADASVGERYPLSSSGNEIWPAVSLPSAYYHQPTSVSHGYVSVGELSLGNSQARQNQSSQAFVLESEIQQKDPLRSFLNRRSDGSDSFFYPYANQDRNELLLHSLFKDPGSSYLHEQKLARLGFHPAGGDSLMGTSQFPRNLAPSLPLDPRQMRLGGDVYMHQQNVQENIFTDGGGRFSIPSQEHLLPLNHVQDWTANGAVNMPMPVPSHHRLSDNGQLASQNWFPEDEVVRDGWSGVVPSQDMGNGGQVADESLFSVLTQYNGLRPVVPFGSTGAPDQFISSGSYYGVGRGSVPPMTTNVGPARGGLSYNEEAQSGSRSNGLGWINLPHGLHDSRSWNDNEFG